MHKLIKRAKNQKGFTLVELMVVVVIIGILVAIAVPIYNNITESAKEKALESNHRILVGAITAYRADNDGDMPGSDYSFEEYVEGGIAGLNAKGPGTYKWDGSVLTSVYGDTT